MRRRPRPDEVAGPATATATTHSGAFAAAVGVAVLGLLGVLGLVGVVVLVVLEGGRNAGTVASQRGTRAGVTAITADAPATAERAPGASGSPDGSSGSPDGSDGSDGSEGAQGAQGAQPTSRSYLARAEVGRLQLFDSPTGGPSATGPLDNPIPSGAPLVLLVTDRRPGWLEVLLPVRPNGSRAWVREADVSVEADDWRVEVHLAEHQLVVYEGAEIWMSEPIAVGREPTPTPGGTFYLIELLRPPDPEGDYGPYAYGLSGFSDDLSSFNGGDGRLGLHGTNDPGTLGRDVSHGCIRLGNEAISQLARVLPLGTPVVILP